MANFASTLKKIRLERGMSLEEFAAFLGTSKQNISRYENGDVTPKISTAAMMAEKLGITLSQLNGDQDRTALPANVRMLADLPRRRVPMLGSVAAGEPIYDAEVDVYVDSPMDCDAAITIRGDSMIPTYQDGDLVYIKCRPEVPDGAVAVVFLDEEATIKHIYKRPTGLTLISDNPAHAPIMAEFEDYNNVRIFGVPVGFTRMYKKAAKPLR